MPSDANDSSTSNVLDADGPPPTFDQAYGDDIEARLRRTEKKAVQACLYNVVLILDAHPDWQCVIAFDSFAGRVMKRRAGPHGGGVGEWADIDDIRATLWLSKTYHIEPKPQMMMAAVQAVAEAHCYHEVRDYLQRLKWDGQPRIAQHGWLHVYCGAEASEYHRLAGQKWLISAVARIMRDAETKADNVLVLEGPQGIGKSTALRILFHPWFTDSPIRLGDKEAAMIIRGRWGIELGELDAFNRAESTTAKNFFSQSEDRYRSPWGKRPQDVRRACVFAGTTNESMWMKDQTGNRRYWPVTIARVDRDELRADRDQLWAEALHLYRQGVPWHVNEDEQPLFDEAQECRLIRDAYEERIEGWLDKERIENGRTQVRMSNILGGALGLDTGKWTRQEQTRVGQVMSRVATWHRKRIRTGQRLEWVYEYVPPVVEAANDEDVPV
jgi:putative DNA primase/helicase